MLTDLHETQVERLHTNFLATEVPPTLCTLQLFWNCYKFLNMDIN
jgi:hypothetical protein